MAKRSRFVDAGIDFISVDDEVSKENPQVEDQPRDETGQWAGGGIKPPDHVLKPFKTEDFDQTLTSWKTYSKDNEASLKQHGAYERANMANAMMLGLGADLADPRSHDDRAFQIKTGRGVEGAIHFSKEKDDEAHINWLASAPWNQQGMPDRQPGTASALLADTFEWADKNGIEKLTLDSTINARDYYHHVGFKDTGESSLSMAIDRDSMKGYLANYRAAKKSDEADRWYKELVALEDKGYEVQEPAKKTVPRIISKAEDEEGGTRAGAASSSWRKYWQTMIPSDGTGKFVYQHHWPAITKEQVNMSDKDLMFNTDHAAHGDLRLEGDKALWGWSVFIGEMKDNRNLPNRDKLIDFEKLGEKKLQTTPKLPQPKDWLKVGVGKPLVAGPGEAGVVGENYAKFFALDTGTYHLGVAREHMFEVFLSGSKLKGRVIFGYAPIGERGRIWLIDRDGKPYTQEHTLESTIKDVRSKGQKYLVWSDPDHKPVFIDVRRDADAILKLIEDGADDWDALKGIKPIAKAADLEGGMLCIQVPDHIAKRIALPDGEPADQLHITLAYFKNGSELSDEQREAIVQTAFSVIDEIQPFTIKLSGCGTFPKNEDDEVPLYVKVESPGLLAMRRKVAEALDLAGIEYSKDHAEYKPHVTLKYLEPDEEVEVKVEAEFQCDEIRATFAQKFTEIPMAMEKMERPYRAEIVKADTDKRFTFGVVYKATNRLSRPQTDAHNEFVTASELQETLWDYVRAGDRRIYVQHGMVSGVGYKEAGEWLELVSWPQEVTAELMLPGQPTKKTVIPANSVWMGVIWKPWAWELVKQGKIRGYSFGGLAGRVAVE